MIYYAIKHTTTGNLLPAGGKGQGGHTKQEACPPEVKPPRLFTSEKSARRAMACYVAGKWSGGYANEGPYPKDQTERNKVEYCVVPIILRIKK